jgi:tol-pal system protein YbgF
MIATTRFRLAALALACAACLPLHAHAGILDDDEARRAILDLRAKVEALSRDVNARIDTKPDRTAIIDLLNQQEKVMQEFAGLRGQLELLANQIANAQKSQKDLYADLDARMRKFEQRQEAIDGQLAEVLPSDKKSYEAALRLFRAADYKGAAVALQDFMQRYPDSTYAPDVQYQLGNAYYLQHDYKNAIAVQELVVSNYGSSGAAPDAMLNIASNYVELKDNKKARKVLQQLMSKYPDSTSAATAKLRLAALK